MLTHDPISGLQNIEAIRQEDVPDGSPRTIAVLTVKDFEDKMSFLGYNFGNTIIEKFVEKLSEILYSHANTELYQYAGMQFILKITHSSSGASADSILAGIEKLNKSILIVDSIPIYIEIQMGITEIPGDTATLSGMRQALIAYSFAKANDLDSSFYDLSLESHYRDILSVASSFTASLANHSIEAAYQYVYSTDTEEIYGAEMLARWKKDDNTNISPELFIPIIEKTDLIRDLTRYMISRALEFVKENRDTSWIVSINFSLKDFSAGSLNYLFDAIENAQVSPERILIEVTERCLVDVADMIKYLTLLRDHNIRVAIDDFGTGYSSYQYVSDLPIDVIKMDKSIISKIDKNATSKSIARSIVDFCRENSIKTLAEGVETREIADACKEIGVDYLQGYYFHRPQLMES